MEFLRKKYVCKNQIKKGISGVKQAMEFINRNHSIALMIDQRWVKAKGSICLETGSYDYIACPAFNKIQS